MVKKKRKKKKTLHTKSNQIIKMFGNYQNICFLIECKEKGQRLRKHVAIYRFFMLLLMVYINAYRYKMGEVGYLFDLFCCLDDK